jgi:predicted ArsR family transcriptional regulator
MGHDCCMEDRNPLDFRLRGSRGAILGHLRRGDATVAEIAAAVELTRNGVRLHLARLEREGLIERMGKARGVSKSSSIYGLTALGRLVYSRAYGVLLRGLVDELLDRLPAPEAAALFAAVARRLVVGRSDPGADFDTRLLGALELLRELGGDPVVTDAPGGARIAIEHCPLADLSAAHPEICGFGRALVEEAIGAPVESRCTRGDRPRCCFELAPLPH